MRASKRLKTLLIYIFIITCQTHESQSQMCGPSSTSTKYDTKYEWEKYDYYRVLGLPSVDQSSSRKKRKDTRDRIDQQQIKKAYRSQAQKYHPDKAHRKNLTSTIEESNQRFARIAEAYEILNDDRKRKNYDTWLLDCEDRNKIQENNFSSGDSWSFSFSDPRKVFEKFWDGGRSQKEPVRVHKTRETLIDPNSAKEILREYRTEEFASDEDGIYMYRVLVQDFVEQYDRFFGGWEYKPVTAPVVVEEGRRSVDSSFQDEHGNQNTLSRDSYMTPRSPPLVSANGQFYARISLQCELIVASTSSFPGGSDDLVKWSSKTYIASRTGRCFLYIKGPYLVLALGSPENPGKILWHSVSSKNIDDSLFSVYFAKLDDDGNLAVYKETDETKPYTYKRIPKILKALGKYLKLGKESSSKTKSNAPATCIFATGTFGCNPQARKMVHMAHGMRRVIERTIVNIDSALDDVWDFIEPEDDEDPLDVVPRLFEKATNSILKVGSSLSKRASKFIREWR